MDRDLKNVIRLVLANAAAAGNDRPTQTALAVRAVLQIRPDMTASAALTAVKMVRWS